MKTGNIRFEVDLENLEEEIKNIEKDIDEAVQETTKQVASMGKNAAQDRIRNFDRIWNKDVLNNWIPLRQKTDHGVTVNGFQNYSKHAAIVDEGAQYTDKKPPVQPLKRYIRDEYPHVRDITTAAFELQDTLYERGIYGIDYTGAAEKRMGDVMVPTFKKEMRKR